MGRAIMAISGSAAGLLPRPFVGLSLALGSQAIGGFWREWAGHLLNVYRPERHYMRGPGPAWQAKYGGKPEN